MKSYLNLFIVLLMSTTGVLAHNSITGKITNDRGQGIYYTTVILYNAEDDKIVNMVAADESGHYSIDNIEDGDYYVAATMLGHVKAKSENISFPNNSDAVIDLELIAYDIELPTLLVLSNKSLNDTVVRFENKIIDKLWTPEIKALPVKYNFTNKSMIEDAFKTDPNTFY